MKKLTIIIIPVLMACTQKMAEEGRIRPYENVRMPPEGTVPRGDTQKIIRLQRDRSSLERGRERFEIYCSPCHGKSGYGDGMIVQRGFLAPPSFHTKRLRTLPDSHYQEVITQGYGAMYSYKDRVNPMDRQAIIYYIRALQLSQNFNYSDLSLIEKQKLLEAAK